MSNIYSFFNKIIIIFISILYCGKLFPSVNIIAWWNYIDNNTVMELQKKCSTTVSFDEYYSIDDFMRRMQKQKYSIAIFPGGVYNLIRERIEKDGVSFDDITRNYQKDILSQFKQQKFSNKVAIFALSSTGFLYDPKQIEINKSDNYKEIFLRAKNKKIALIDDPFESLNLISLEKKVLNVIDGVKGFKQLVNGSNFIITNDILKIVKEKDFAFAYTWVGVSYKRISENPHLKFILLPKSSYIAADFLTVMDKNPQTVCVGKMLAGKEILNSLLSKTFYFSPYGIPDVIEDKRFYLEYKSFVDNQKDLKWIENPKKEEFQKMTNLWQKIKIIVENKFY